MVYKNAEKLASAYAEIMNKIYNEAADTAFQDFKKKAEELIVKFADKDENGKIKRDINGQYIITEKLEEFKAADKKLVEDSKEILDARQIKMNETMKYLDLSNEYSLLTIKLTDFPNEAAPGIVGIFAEV